MADSGNKSGSHLGFFVALLAVVLIGAGGYWVYATYVVPVEDQQATAAANPSSSRPKNADKKPSAGTDKPAANVSSDGK